MKLLLKRVLYNAWVLLLCYAIALLFGWRNWWSEVGPGWAIVTVSALTAVDYLAAWVGKLIKRKSQ